MIKLSKFRQLIAAAVFSLTVFSVSNVYAASYSVVSGDSLYTIGKLFGTTSTVLMQDNQLSASTIYPGQVLQVPGTVYTVKAGDSLYLIAKRYNVSLTLLRKANNQWQDMIDIGEKLVIPAGTAAASTAATTAGITANTTAGTSSLNAGTSSLTPAEIDLLARLITAEADGEPYNAKVAVGAVVLNRVKDSRFPNTVTSVIYQKDSLYYQFTPVENGFIYKPASADSIKAAYEAASGVDPTHGAVYYFDDSATNKWLWSRPLALRTGKMVFTY